jgi:hypothetical protein
MLATSSHRRGYLIEPCLFIFFPPVTPRPAGTVNLGAMALEPWRFFIVSNRS